MAALGDTQFFYIEYPDEWKLIETEDSVILSPNENEIGIYFDISTYENISSEAEILSAHIGQTDYKKLPDSLGYITDETDGSRCWFSIMDKHSVYSFCVDKAYPEILKIIDSINPKNQVLHMNEISKKMGDAVVRNWLSFKTKSM